MVVRHLPPKGKILAGVIVVLAHEVALEAAADVFVHGEGLDWHWPAAVANEAHESFVVAPTNHSRLDKQERLTFDGVGVHVEHRADVALERVVEPLVRVRHIDPEPVADFAAVGELVSQVLADQ